MNALPVLGALLVILLILAIPAVAREVRNRQLAVAARRGDAASAWTMVQDGAIDLSIPVPASETSARLREPARARSRRAA